MIKIIPSILTNDPQELADLIRKSEQAVDRAHIDIIDGVFADNKTIMPESVAAVPTDLSLDYHLMVKDPIKWVEKSIRGFADRIIGQIEMMESLEDFVDDIVTKGYKAGLAIDLDTLVSELNNDILGEVDVVLVMSVPAGFGGQDFSVEALDKISELDRLRKENDLKYTICDDGGVSLENIDDTHYLGADEVSIGSRLFKGDIKINIEKFQKAAHELDLM